MPLTQFSDFSPVNAPYAGVIPQPYVSSLGGYTYKYESKGGKRKSNKKRNQKKYTKKARKNQRSRRTRYNR